MARETTGLSDGAAFKAAAALTGSHVSVDARGREIMLAAYLKENEADFLLHRVVAALDGRA